jgi:hypothetical protein
VSDEPPGYTDNLVGIAARNSLDVAIGSSRAMVMVFCRDLAGISVILLTSLRMRQRSREPKAKKADGKKLVSSDEEDHMSMAHNGQWLGRHKTQDFDEPKRLVSPALQIGTSFAPSP